MVVKKIAKVRPEAMGEKEEQSSVKKIPLREPVSPARATIQHSTYSNVFCTLEKDDEVVLMFGQVPLLNDGSVLTTRIYMSRVFAKDVVEMLKSTLDKEKTEESDDRHTYG